MIHSENRIIAFIDILGFKEFIKCAEKANDYTKLSNLIEESIELFNSFNPTNDFQFTQFSDSFVLSCRSFNLNDSMVFMIHLQDLIHLFLSENILLRSGITIGKVVHTENVLMGTGMNRAYELESQLAKYPRIIIDNDLINYWNDSFYSEGLNFENVLEVSKDSDDFYFMDYINKSNLPPMINILLNKSYELLNSNIPSLVDKGVWLMKKLENHLKYIIQSK